MSKSVGWDWALESLGFLVLSTEVAPSQFQFRCSNNSQLRKSVTVEIRGESLLLSFTGNQPTLPTTYWHWWWAHLVTVSAAMALLFSSFLVSHTLSLSLSLSVSAFLFCFLYVRSPKGQSDGGAGCGVSRRGEWWREIWRIIDTKKWYCCSDTKANERWRVSAAAQVVQVCAVCCAAETHHADAALSPHSLRSVCLSVLFDVASDWKSMWWSLMHDHQVSSLHPRLLLHLPPSLVTTNTAR